MPFFCSWNSIPPVESADLLYCKQSREERSAHLLFVYMKCEHEQGVKSGAFGAEPLLTTGLKSVCYQIVALSRYSWGRNIENYIL